jgi:hypothetical protein
VIKNWVIALSVVAGCYTSNVCRPLRTTRVATRNINPERAPRMGQLVVFAGNDPERGLASEHLNKICGIWERSRAATSQSCIDGLLVIW